MTHMTFEGYCTVHSHSIRPSWMMFWKCCWDLLAYAFGTCEVMITQSELLESLLFSDETTLVKVVNNSTPDANDNEIRKNLVSTFNWVDFNLNKGVLRGKNWGEEKTSQLPHYRKRNCITRDAVEAQRKRNQPNLSTHHRTENLTKPWKTKKKSPQTFWWDLRSQSYTLN